MSNLCGTEKEEKQQVEEKNQEEDKTTKQNDTNTKSTLKKVNNTEKLYVLPLINYSTICEISTQDTIEWYMMKLALAEYHLQRGNEDDAFEIYKSILDDVVINNHIDDKYHDIAYKAYKGLSKVTWNGRDYIWEAGVSIIDNYKHLFDD